MYTRLVQTYPSRWGTTSPRFMCQFPIFATSWDHGKKENNGAGTDSFRCISREKRKKIELIVDHGNHPCCLTGRELNSIPALQLVCFNAEKGSRGINNISMSVSIFINVIIIIIITARNGVQIVVSVVFFFAYSLP